MVRLVNTLHGNSLQTISNFYHYIMKWNHGTMPNLKYFWLIFHFHYFRKRKVHFLGGSTQSFCMSPFWFILHMAYTCGEDHKRDFSSHFSTIFCVPIVEIGIICRKGKENVINHLNIANESRKMPNLHSNYFMVYVQHRKKNHLQTTKVCQLSFKI